MSNPPHPTIRLLPATVPMLRALRDDPAAFARLIGSPVPEGWPEFPEAIAFTIEALEQAARPDRATGSERSWLMRLFLDDATGALVGSGGYAGPPTARTVEIGYEVAPAFRGRGLGAGAARALVDEAFASGEVDRVVAHTLPGPNPSTGVLTSLGFARVGERDDPEEGVVWAWSLERATAREGDGR